VRRGRKPPRRDRCFADRVRRERCEFPPDAVISGALRAIPESPGHRWRQETGWSGGRPGRQSRPVLPVSTEKQVWETFESGERQLPRGQCPRLSTSGRCLPKSQQGSVRQDHHSWRPAAWIRDGWLTGGCRPQLPSIDRDNGSRCRCLLTPSCDVVRTIRLVPWGELGDVGRHRARRGSGSRKHPGC
jgi:hypothetical protein